MKRVVYGVGALAILAAGAAIVLSQMKVRATNAFEAEFNQLKASFAKAQHGAIDFDLWKRELTVNDILLLPVNSDEASATRISKLTATGVSQTGDRITADRVAIARFAATILPIGELSGRVRYEAPTITLDQFSTRAFPASSGISALAWTRQVLLGTTATSITIPSLKSVAALPQPPAAAAITPQPGLAAPLEQLFTNVRLDGIRDGKIAKATVEHARATSRMQPPIGGEFSAETRGSFVADYDIAASIALLDPDASVPQQGFTTVWKTAGSGPVTVKAGSALTMSVSGLTADSIAFDMAKFRSAFAAMQASIAKSGPRASPAQAQATLVAIADLYESVNLGVFEYKDLAIEVPGMQPTRSSLMRLEGYERGTLAKFTIKGLDGVTPQGGAYHLDNFALDGLKLSQIMRLTKDFATPAAVQSAQAGWALMQTLAGIRLDGFTAPGQTPNGAPMRIDTVQANWGNFIGSMPTTGAFKMKAQMPLGPTSQEPLATLAQLGVRDPSLSFDGKWKWSEAAKTLEIGPVSSEIAEAASAGINLSVGNVQRPVLDGGPMMLAIALPEFKIGPIAIDLKDLGLLRLLRANAAMASQVEMGIQSLRAVIEALPPEKTEQRAVLEGVVKFLATPGSRLSIAMTPKGDVPLGALLAAGQAGPQMLGFLTEHMTTKVIVSP